jgi:hypothetical protein
MSWIRARGEIHPIQRYLIKLVGDFWQSCSFIRVLQFSTPKTKYLDFTEVLLNMMIIHLPASEWVIVV